MRGEGTGETVAQINEEHFGSLLDRLGPDRFHIAGEIRIVLERKLPAHFGGVYVAPEAAGLKDDQVGVGGWVGTTSGKEEAETQEAETSNLNGLVHGSH